MSAGGGSPQPAGPHPQAHQQVQVGEPCRPRPLSVLVCSGRLVPVSPPGPRACASSFLTSAPHGSHPGGCPRPLFAETAGISGSATLGVQ